MYGFTESFILPNAYVCTKCYALVERNSCPKHHLWHQMKGDNIPIEELNLPVRAFTALRRWDITTIEGLIGYIEDEYETRSWDYPNRTAVLYNIPNLGEKTISQIESELRRIGYLIGEF